MVFGVVPACLVGRLQTAPGSVRAGAGERGAGVRRMRATLVTLQAALTLALVAGSLTMGRGFLKLLGTDLGFQTSHVVTLSVSVAGTPYDTPSSEYGEARLRRREPRYREPPYYSAALARLRAVPGVTSAGAVEFVPLDTGLRLGDYFEPPSGQRIVAIVDTATPDYFRSIGAALVEGRDFTDADRAGADRVAIVTDVFVREAGPGARILGAKFTWPSDLPPLTIVGVVHSTHRTLLAKPIPEVYFPIAQRPPRVATFVVRVNGDAERYLAICRDALRGVNPRVAVFNVQTLDQRLRTMLARPRFYTTAVLFFGGFALLLAVVATYGVASYSIAQRTHEIGVRIAVGATPLGLRGMLLRQSMAPVAAGMVVGVAGAVALGRVLQSLVATAEPTGAWVCAAAAAILLATAAAAIWTAGGRIVRMDPTAALRAE